jgi:predicted nucleic acid-binding protein
MKKSTRSSTRSETFVDTSGFYSLLVQRDPMHVRANGILSHAARVGGRFVTTDYVLDETATLLKARGQAQLTDAFFSTVFNSAVCRVEWMDPERFLATRRFFLKHADKDWSFTDSFGFWLMRLLGLSEALTTDGHFRQAGFIPLLL